MSNETARIRATDSERRSAQDQLRQVMQDTADLIEALRTHQNTLRARGMNLPPGTIDNLRVLQMRLTGMVNTLTSRQMELRQFRALAENTALINSTLELDAVLNQVMDTVILLTGAERGYLLLRDDDGQMHYRTLRGIDREQLMPEDLVISNTIVNEVISTGRAVVTDSARDDPRYRLQDSIMGYNLRSILAVPLKVRDAVIGVVYCDNRSLANLFKEGELNLLTAFANQAAVAIQNAQLFESARARLAEITAMRDMMDSIFASIANGLITLDRDNVITAFNPAAEAITGVSPERAFGARVEDLIGNIEGGVFMNALNRVRETGSPETVEVELISRGKPRFWNVTISPLADADTGDRYGIAIVLDDLTETREREAQFSQVRTYFPSAMIENLRSADLSTLGGQQREISVVFADVRGFTTFSERLQPEDLMEIINKYLTVASDAIDLREGIVEKYMGDAVTGLFNTQLNQQPDHALLAVQAALTLVYEVRELHTTLPEEHRLYYGIGIHTGPAVLGNVGSAERREFTAIGEAVEMSKLLQENALHGEIIISEATYAQVRDQIECEPIAPRKTKDRPGFTVMYKVIGRRRRTA